MKFAEAWKKFSKVVWSYTCPCISYLYYQLLIDVVVTWKDLNLSFFCELKCIFNQINKYLLKTALISYEL